MNAGDVLFCAMDRSRGAERNGSGRASWGGSAPRFAKGGAHHLALCASVVDATPLLSHSHAMHAPLPSSEALAGACALAVAVSEERPADSLARAASLAAAMPPAVLVPMLLLAISDAHAEQVKVCA